VLRALNSPRVESKQIWDCIQALNNLASDRPVTLAWVPGHSGIPGNERADQLARVASSLPQPSHELTLPVPYSRVKSVIRSWADKEANEYWQGIKTCRQTEQMIQVYSRRRAREFGSKLTLNSHGTVHGTLGTQPSSAHYGSTKQPILYTM